MLSVKFTWLEAAVAAAMVLAVAAGAALARRRSGSPRLTVIAVFAREAGMLLGLFALWAYAGSKSEVSLAEAMHRAAWIWHAERDVGLPSEQAVQQAFLPHPLLLEALNWYYAVLHFPAMIGCLVWLFARHRGEYWRVRTLVVLFTAVSLLVQLIPVAPPRLLPLTQMTDTGLAYGQSVYGPHAGIDADQLSAMPSIHIGWALLVALVVVTTARGRWRWLALAYPALTTLAVVVTANHFWLDGIAAAVLLALSIAVQRASRGALADAARGLARRAPALVTAGMAAMGAAAGAAGMVPLAAGGIAGRPAGGPAGGGERAGRRGAGSPAHGRAQAAPAGGAAPARAHASPRGRTARRDVGGYAATSPVSAGPVSRQCLARGQGPGRGGRAGQSREQDGR
jgi:hypothetical protein